MANNFSPRDPLEVLSAPLGDIIASVGLGIAEAQQALDNQAISSFKAIYAENSAAFAALREIGYQPTWYQIPEASVELSVAMTVQGQAAERSTTSLPRPVGVQKIGLRIYGAPVDAGYSNKYDYSINAASKLTVRFVPVPPPIAAVAMRVIPSLVGQSLGAVRSLLSSLGIAFEFDEALEPKDDWVVSATDPPAGGILATGQGLRLDLAPT